MKAFFKTHKGMAIIAVIVAALAIGGGLFVRDYRNEKAADEEAKVHFGLAPEVPKLKTLEVGEWSPPIVLLDNRVRTFPADALVEFKDTETGKVTTVGPHDKVHLRGVNVVRIRSTEKIRYIVERQ